MLSDILLILGSAIFSIALRSFRYVLLQKLGALGILATSFLAGYLLTDNIIAGIFCALSWFLLPWLEILTRIRNLRLPPEKNLRRKNPPSEEIFPALDPLTEEVEETGFIQIEDAGWDWEDYQQFFRLFYNDNERSQATICVVDQQDVAFYYLSISSRAKDGTVWTTWNYPFSYSLKLVPQLKTQRVSPRKAFHELYENHRAFLARNGISTEQLEILVPEQITEEMQKDLRAQITHNLAAGVLTKTDEGQIRYSWRGLFFIWIQFLRDLVRLS